MERRHDEFEPASRLGRDVDLRMEQLTDPADPRFAAVHREVVRDTLDAHDAAAVRRLGFDGACAEGLAYLLDADPVECLHLAHDASGAVVALVSGLTMPGGRGFVLFVGVARDHRGHGHGGELLAWITRRLIEAGSTTLIADTDTTNAPMAAAFAREGWPQTETRLDLVVDD